LPPDPPFLPHRDPGLRAAAARFRAAIGRIRAEQLVEKAARATEASLRRQELASRLLAAAMFADPLAN
jgi:hypothetical protein